MTRRFQRLQPEGRAMLQTLGAQGRACSLWDGELVLIAIGGRADTQAHVAPRQRTARLARDDPQHHLREPRGELRKALLACLRQDRSTRRPRSARQDRRGQISEVVSIHVRPPEVADRLMPGHWKDELLKVRATSPPWAYCWSARHVCWRACRTQPPSQPRPASPPSRIRSLHRCARR